ncbi:hypothetical protein [Amycolatopsis magusensis]|uniref:Small secreted domain n=1 Tax=Amycolatopsis magusensis TaxID=882444 RepID=A0ABS4PT58_9PSEU|nr:hypothetical protein [Amycolatopsis magusensis]MBP2182616.1 hypothetical protein [Amycolatopsis magusensis]MDI5982502.1 hypothetical protein [Amycolatopsis magusensis]
MLKKFGAAIGSVGVGLMMFGGVASAGEVAPPVEHDDQVGLLNLNNLDVLHNVNAVVGVCDNNINVLGVQVPVHDVANGIGIPILSPGVNQAEGENPYNCASGGVVDGGSIQDN